MIYCLVIISCSVNDECFLRKGNMIFIDDFYLIYVVFKGIGEVECLGGIVVGGFV